MSRFKYKGAGDGWARMEGILVEFEKDQLRRDPENNVGAPWKWGIIGEFPESGLVPTVVVYGLMGIDVSLNSLIIAPSLPDKIEWAQVSQLIYKGASYQIRAEKNKNGNMEKLVIEAKKAFKDNSFVIGSLSANAEYSLQTDAVNKKLVSDKTGYIYLDKISAKKIVLTRIRNL